MRKLSQAQRENLEKMRGIRITKKEITEKSYYQKQ